MYIDREETQIYPFIGDFYRAVVVEGESLLDRVERDEIIFSTKCDIVEANHTRRSNAIQASYAIYFPFNKETDRILIKNGDTFKSNVFGYEVNGIVIGVFPSQLSGCVVYIQDNDI